VAFSRLHTFFGTVGIHSMKNWVRMSYSHYYITIAVSIGFAIFLVIFETLLFSAPMSTVTYHTSTAIVQFLTFIIIATVFLCSLISRYSLKIIYLFLFGIPLIVHYCSDSNINVWNIVVIIS